MICRNRNTETIPRIIRKRAVPVGAIANKKRQPKRGSRGEEQDVVKTAFAISMCRSCKMYIGLFPINYKCGTTPVGR